MPLAEAQVQTHLIAFLLFPGIQRDLLHQLRQLKFADLSGPGVALDGLFRELRGQLRRFFMLKRLFQRFWRGDHFLDRFNNGSRLPAVCLFFRRGFCSSADGAGRDCTRSVTEASRSSAALFTGRALAGAAGSLFWFGCSLRTLQLASCGKHRTGGIRQRHVLRRRRCRLRWHLLR